ncbi:MAG: PEGA domain-containing protein [Acidobacteriota bacterium]
MKCARCLILLFLISMSSMVFSGDIQVLCEPGLRVYLDGQFMGLSSEKEDGLYLMNVEAGEHRVWIEKDGFLSQSFEVELLALPIEVTVAEFTPLPEMPQREVVASAEVTQMVGNLIVTSAPQNCVVAIDGVSETKDSPQILIGGLAVGEHVITFSKPGFDRISGVVSIEAGAELRVRGNLKSGKVEIVHEGKGSLRVMSTPSGCTVGFRGKTHKKTTQRLNLSKIPAGEYAIFATWKGLELSSKVMIKKGKRTLVNLSFMKNDEPWVISYEPE